MTTDQIEDFINGVGVMFLKNKLLTHFQKIANEVIQYEFLRVKYDKNSNGHHFSIFIKLDINTHEQPFRNISFGYHNNKIDLISEEILDYGDVEKMLDVEYRRWKISRI